MPTNSGSNMDRLGAIGTRSRATSPSGSPSSPTGRVRVVLVMVGASIGKVLPGTGSPPGWSPDGSPGPTHGLAGLAVRGYAGQPVDGGQVAGRQVDDAQFGEEVNPDRFDARGG